MKTITNYFIVILLCFSYGNSHAQDSIPETKEIKIKKLKQIIEETEKEALKIEVEQINDRVLNKEITNEQGEDLKQEMAKKRALNIENRMTIMEQRFDFYERNNIEYDLESNNKKSFAFITFGNNKSNPLGLSIETSNQDIKPVKYDFRTISGLVFSTGFNNAIIDGQSLSDSPYKISGSGYVELGFQWKTRILKNSNLARLRYGVSFQWNKYDIKDNLYFAQDGNNTTLENFPIDLKQAKFRTTNIVVPLYFEIGQHNKIEKTDRIRYVSKGFKFGFGGYAGLNIEAKQKLKYNEDGAKTKQKIKQDYNVNPFVYGLGTYIGYNDISLFLKYDLSNTFKDNSIKQNNISLGLRFDIE